MRCVCCRYVFVVEKKEKSKFQTKNLYNINSIRSRFTSFSPNICIQSILFIIILLLFSFEIDNEYFRKLLMAMLEFEFI